MRPIFLAKASELFQFPQSRADFGVIITEITRYLFPILAILILVRCIRSLLSFRKEPEIWGWLNVNDETLLPVTHWENLIGTHKRCDIVIDDPDIRKNHAVLTRYDDGSWTISDIAGKGGVYVNGKRTSISAVDYEDEISLNGISIRLEPVTQEDRRYGMLERTKAGKLVYPAPTLIFLTIFQILAGLQLIFQIEKDYMSLVALSFGFLIVAQWALFTGLKAMRRSGFEIETIAFFLSTLGLSVIGSGDPGELMKAIISILLGIIIYLLVGWSLRDLERAKKIRYVAAIFGVVMLLSTLVLGTEVKGAKNWIYIGGISLQPSEITKLCFIFVGAATMDRMVTKRNLILFIAYSAVICGCLALMSDFGTALIFFVSFLVIAFLRSGSFATLALSLTATGFAGSVALSLKPYIKNRFKVWGHVWENIGNNGHQQVSAMMCIASGGLFGLGVGCGEMKHVFAGDCDLVFAFVSEEWGLIIGLLSVVSIAIICLFVVRSSGVARSSFYTIGACAAATILLMQTVLNVFGTVDFLPLTGVTFPFVSNGGSSMLSSWGLLAFIKAADTRQNASFAVRLSMEGEASE
ncbi:MAG: FtsW/RodA/SpoVE family cell cycle protein [Clostridia bacterium]|nr:FtsW/RodA/SpoVE family cell cycle protein [Clostridia bacterium]